MKNVVILGDSDLGNLRGLSEGLKQSGLNVVNLCIGATTTMHKLYELKLKENKQIFELSDLIIYHSNGDDSAYFFSQEHPYREINWFFKELFFLNRKVLVLLLPAVNDQFIRMINNLQRKLCRLYGFSIVDFNNDTFESDTFSFLKDDGLHFFPFILRKLGRDIGFNIDKFKLPYAVNIVNDNPRFEICFMDQMKINGQCEIQKASWLHRSFNVYKLKKGNIVKFPTKYYNYNLLAMCTHNLNVCFFSSLAIDSKHYSTVYLSRPHLALKSLSQYINIDESCSIYFNFEKKIDNIDQVFPCNGDLLGKTLDFAGLISCFLASPEGNYYIREIDFEALANENIEILKEYDFNHLIPPLEFYKEIINEYCSIMDPRKLAQLQKQISDQVNTIQKLNSDNQRLQQQYITLQNDLNAIPIKRQTLEIENLNQDLVIKKLQTKRLEQKLKLNSSFIYLPREQSAKERIQNHLSYKLGKVMVENSKNVLDCVSLPFILLCIVFLHRKEQRKYKIKIKQNPKLSLPFLETYPDYYQALREKECFTYKLGEAFIKASKNWYKGGYLIFILRDVPRLNMELKQKNRN